MINWLIREKELVASISTIIQSFAVVIGMIVVVNEFVLKNHDLEMENRQRSLDLYSNYNRSDALLRSGILYLKTIGIIDKEKLKKIKAEETSIAHLNYVINKYTEIQTCIDVNACDKQLLLALFCPYSHTDSSITYKLWINPKHWGQPTYDPRVENVFTIAKLCRSNSSWFLKEGTDGRALEWLQLQDHYEQEDKKHLEKLDKNEIKDT